MLLILSSCSCQVTSIWFHLTNTLNTQGLGLWQRCPKTWCNTGRYWKKLVWRLPNLYRLLDLILRQRKNVHVVLRDKCDDLSWSIQPLHYGHWWNLRRWGRYLKRTLFGVSQKLVLDDEDKKTEYYIRLTVSLARSSLNDDENYFYPHTEWVNLLWYWICAQTLHHNKLANKRL